jgi:hypothetical protein
VETVNFINPCTTMCMKTKLPTYTNIALYPHITYPLKLYMLTTPQPIDKELIKL